MSARVIDVYANVQGRDLGAVGAGHRHGSWTEPHNSAARIHGAHQGPGREHGLSSIGALAGRARLRVVLVYLLMVVNFQSWLDPLVILMALPGALAGIAWMLFLSHTTLSVPALMGSIMCVGVATANSILVVTFANDAAPSAATSASAALAAGMTRLRPVIMTALAMIIGMLPMSLGLGEGGEQNAPLGRAVIGGLLLATVTTLLFVPVVFSFLHARRAPRLAVSPGAAELSRLRSWVR